MLADCLAGERQFGITRSTQPTPGMLGTVAAIEAVHPLPDGRSNIVVSGKQRFLVRSVPTQFTPYLLADVETISDDAGSEPPGHTLIDLRRTVGVIRDALSLLRDEPVPLPDLPESAEGLSFAAAALSEADLDTSERLLALRSTRERVELLSDILRTRARTAREHAAIHLRARSNGQGHDRESPSGPDS
jgi:Lon protease-like protein